jgi:hypothetical protein
VNIITGTRKFSEAEFEQLFYVTEEALEQNKPIVTRTADAIWYVLYDTPEGRHLTAKIRDVDGIRQTQVFNLKYVHMWFKLAPEKVTA